MVMVDRVVLDSSQHPTKNPQTHVFIFQTDQKVFSGTTAKSPHHHQQQMVLVGVEQGLAGGRCGWQAGKGLSVHALPPMPKI